LQQKSHLAHLAGAAGCDVFVEWIGPPLALVVFGAGHDAQPLVRFAKELGWQVTVADGRANYATQERFPRADRVVVIDAQNPLKGMEVTRETAVVMMTHNYQQDAALLRHILPAKPRYLGLLGPKSRTEDLLKEVALPVTGIDLHAPVGLDLGSDAPASIALAIVGEIQAVLHARAGGMLKDRQGPIHEAALESGVADQKLSGKTEVAVCELA
jgi:xanthine/CO dehydrogenase XdhC/CoxF family maturation factor